jgi:hypothetical protein
MPKLIDTGFKLINMIVLTYFFLRLFYKYILPLLQAEMSGDKAFSLALENQKVLLSQEKDILKKNIQQEMLEQHILKQKLFSWNSSIDQLKIVASLSQQQLADTIYERKVAVQKKQLEIEMEQTITNNAITEAEEILKEFFNNEHEGTHYIVQLIEQSSIQKGS